MEVAYSTLLAHPVAKSAEAAALDVTANLALDGKAHPRILTYVFRVALQTAP